MNNQNPYRVVSIKPRRKHIVALKLEPDIEKGEIKCETDEKGHLLLDLSLLEDGIISENMLLDFEGIEALVNESYFRKAKSKALWHLSTGDHSKKGLLRKLMRCYPEAACIKAVERMCDLGYIDDEKFARNSCEVLSSRGLSNSAIISKLVSLGVASDLAKECVRNAGNDQIEQIDMIIKKRYINKLSDAKSIEKTIAALARRGFSFSDIRAAIKKYTDTEFNEEC